MNATLSHERVSDARAAEVDVTDAPPHYTPAGKRPIAPHTLRVSYHDHGDGLSVRYVELLGFPLDPRTLQPIPGGNTVVRRFGPGDDAPAWARSFILANRPAWWRSAPVAVRARRAAAP